MVRNRQRGKQSAEIPLCVKDLEIRITNVDGGYVMQAKYDRRVYYLLNGYLLAEYR